MNLFVHIDVFPHSMLLTFVVIGLPLLVSPSTKTACDWSDRPDPAGPDSSALMKERDEVVRAERKARDEQKHTLGSCCSQQQVQRGGGGEQTGVKWWRVLGASFVERRGRARGANTWLAFAESNSVS